ncbi:MAG: hypothetical protein AAFX81_15630 [Pseudomonadota bacterium]
MARPRATAALRVGHRRLDLVAVGPDHDVLTTRTAPNPPCPDGPYPRMDVDHVWRWLLAALADFGETFAIDAIVPTAHGRTAALVDGRDLLLPLMDPVATPPPDVVEAYLDLAPDPTRVGAQLGPACSTLGLQLFWQVSRFAPLLDRARYVLPHAQYWGWRLTGGGAAADLSSLGRASHLVEPRGRRVSALVRDLELQTRLPPLRQPQEPLGRLAGPVAEFTGLSAATPVLVGADDQAAAHGRFLAAGLETATIIVDDDGPQLLDVVAPSREPPIDAATQLISGLDGRPLARRTLVDASASVARAIDCALTQTGARGAVVVEAGPAADESIWPQLATHRAAHGQAVFTTPAETGFAIGASILAGWRGRRRPPRLDLTRVVPPNATDD